MSRSLRSDRHEDPVQKLRRDLQNKDLLGVLESLPAPDSYGFQRTRKSGRAAIKLCLGNRPRIDGTPCRAWARIERRDSQPPVTFYDQEPLEDGTRSLKRQYVSSATSLLRRATDLKPPFCFLQHDPFDDLKGARSMLCAIILYQTLVTGVETSALRWDQFRDSLIQALRYINSRSVYHQWRHEQNFAAIWRSQLSIRRDATNEAGDDTDDAEARGGALEGPQAIANSGKIYAGGEVRPNRGVVIKPNTSLARLKKDLGDKKAHFLDQIPRLPMKITPHNLGPSYFPFRMLIGSHTWKTGQAFEVFAYLEQDRGKGAAMRFLSHDDTGHEQSFTMDQLLGITLLQPLEYLNNYKKTTYADGRGSSARTAKIRSIISYYFFVAENEGLIGDPRVRIGDAFVKRLCAAVKEMRNASFSDECNDSASNRRDEHNDSEADAIDDTVPLHKPRQRIDEVAAKVIELAEEVERVFGSSRIVKLRIQPGSLKKFQDQEQRIAGVVPSHRNESQPDNATADGSLVEDVPTMGLELRHSSQNARRFQELLISVPVVQGDLHQLSAPTTSMEIPSDKNRAEEQVHGQVPSAASSTLNEGSVADTVSMNKTAKREDKRSNVHPLSNDAYPGRTRSATSSVDREPASFGAPTMSLSTEKMEVGGDEDTSVDVASSVSVKSPSHVPSIPITMSRANSESDDPLTSSHDARIRVAQVLDNNPPTPEGSVERELKARTATYGLPQGSRHNPVILDPSSDAENTTTTLRTRRPRNGQSMEAEGGIVDLAQPSPLWRGRKRKSSGTVHIFDSDDEAIEEINGDTHRRAQLRRRR